MTAALGLGLCPCGLAPYGIGTPAATLPIASPLFVDPQGIQQTGRRIDPTTKQYTYNANGRTAGMSTAVQAMYLACKTELGSSVIADMGQDISTIKDITPNIQGRVRAVYERATQRIVAQGLVEIVSITAELQELPSNAGTRLFTRIRFKDLTTGKPEEIMT